MKITVSHRIPEGSRKLVLVTHNDFFLLKSNHRKPCIRVESDCRVLGSCCPEQLYGFIK